MTVRRYEEKDYGLLKSIFKKVYKGNPALQKKDYFDWQFRKHPFNDGEQHTLWVLENDSKIEGFYGWVPVRVIYNGSVQMGCEPLIWWVEKSSRSSGLELLGKIINDFPIRLYHGCSEDSIRIFKSFSMPLFSLSRWIAILETEKVVSLFKIKDKEKLKELSENCIRNSKHKTFSGISAIDRFQDEDEMRFDHWPTVRNHLQYKGKYLNWRYFDILDHHYRAIIFNKSAELGVYRIERIKGYEFSILRIIEWSFGYESGLRALAFLSNEAKKEKAILVDFFCSAKEIGLTFEKYGFVSSRISPFNSIPLLFRPIHFSGDFITCIDVPPYRNKDSVDFNEWYITKGNCDLDREKI